MVRDRRPAARDAHTLPWGWAASIPSGVSSVLRVGSIAVVIALVAAVAAPFASATSAGPQPATAGVPAGGGFPAETTCVSCHASAPLNPDTQGHVELRGLPERYQPGGRYPLTFAIVHPDTAMHRWGFQLTPVARATWKGAGELVVTDPKTTQVVTGGVGDRQYIEHSYGGTGVGREGGYAWSFEWVAPDRDLGDVAFFGAGNAANLDGSKEGDRVYSPSPAPLGIVHGPASGAPAGANVRGPSRGTSGAAKEER